MNIYKSVLFLVLGALGALATVFTVWTLAITPEVAIAPQQKIEQQLAVPDTNKLSAATSSQVIVDKNGRCHDPQTGRFVRCPWYNKATNLVIHIYDRIFRCYPTASTR